MSRKKVLAAIFFIANVTVRVLAQNTLPSCVITSPHNNSYFQAGKAITIRVYSTDIGGSYPDGTVSKVEFFNGNTKLGEATSHVNYTYEFVWNNVPAGSYTITAKATDNQNAVSTSAGVVVTVGTAAPVSRGLSACKGKYLANIVAGSVPSNYMNYWNGITSENNHKWGVVESSRNNMNWNGGNVSYNYAKNNYLMFRYHAIAWGSQFPGWAINTSTNQLSISAADFQAEVQQYINAIAAQYPNSIDQIDVLNEQLRTHAPATQAFKTGLGGGGATGYDWIIWLFTRTRQAFPNAKLILNDYGLENDQSAINEQLQVIKVLRDRNLIDGFGTQAHEFNINTLTANTLRNALNLMDNAGVPIYVTELDISGDDNTQRNRYQTLFPVYWEHPAVAGITLWGYEEGRTWKANTQLIRSNGTDRPAMTWLKEYMAGRADVKYPFCNRESVLTSVENEEIREERADVYPNPFAQKCTFELSGQFSYRLYDISGIEMAAGEGHDSIELGEGLPKGVYVLKVQQGSLSKVARITKQF